MSQYVHDLITHVVLAIHTDIQTTMSKRSPSDFLKTILGRPIIVKLNSGVEYRGETLCDVVCVCVCMCMCACVVFV